MLQKFGRRVRDKYPDGKTGSRAFLQDLGPRGIIPPESADERAAEGPSSLKTGGPVTDRRAGEATPKPPTDRFRGVGPGNLPAGGRDLRRRATGRTGRRDHGRRPLARSDQPTRDTAIPSSLSLGVPVGLSNRTSSTAEQANSGTQVTETTVTAYYRFLARPPRRGGGAPGSKSVMSVAGVPRAAPLLVRAPRGLLPPGCTASAGPPAGPMGSIPGGPKRSMPSGPKSLCGISGGVIVAIRVSTSTRSSNSLRTTRIPSGSSSSFRAS